MTLQIFLLGQFNLRVNDQPLKLPSRPAQSLLAYLVIHAGMKQRREKLAGLLWPEATETNARSYLRQALWRIRKALEGSSLDSDRFLDVDDISVTFSDDAAYWLDVAGFLSPGSTPALDALLSAVALYKGELLPGFYDEWIFPERDHLQAAYHQKMGELLERLLVSERWMDAVHWGEQWIRLGHSPEAAFRALLRAYAGLGDRGMAHSTYKRCVEALDRELGIEPSPETQQLYESILLEQRDIAPHGVGRTPDQRVNRPPFLDAGGGQESDKPLFVARENELAQLEGFLNRALEGRGQVIFITGEAGSGKTALIQEFAQYAHDNHPDLVVAAGYCNAHTGIGDPYLPFREILELLAGDVEAQWAAGAISSDHALRLWAVLPITCEALVETGPDLINTFIPGDGLAHRAQAHQSGTAVWKARLLDLVERKAADRGILNLQQTALLEQVTRVLKAISRQVPLVLVVDDLQWADLGSISLLFHLGRQLLGSRILLIGAYRPEEIAIGRDDQRHPLASVVGEFQRQYGDLLVDLDLAERTGFVEAVLDSEPNRLGTSFRQLLFRQTNGHPLFTIELLRGLQERGDLQRDMDGRWVEGPFLDWEKQPARVEAVVAERVGRLAPPLREALRVASVEGEVFTAEVVAQIRGCGDDVMMEYLSGDLDRRHHLVRAHSIIRIDGRLLSRYRFRHIQIQKYLYSSLDEVERVHLHKRAGSILENLYGGQDEAAAIAPQLARHFQEAGITHKAILYLQQAGERALQLSAYQEAVAHLSDSLSLLDTQPESGDRAALEVDLQLALGRAWLSKGLPAMEMEAAYIRARDLCRQLGLNTQLSIASGGLAILNYVRGQHHQTLEFAQEALSIAQKEQQPTLELLGHWYLGLSLFGLGEYTTARENFILAIHVYDPEEHHHSLVEMRGVDAGVSAIAYDACCLWCLGFPDQAIKRREEAFALARQMGHPFTLEDVLCYAGGMLGSMRRDAPSLKNSAEEMIELARANSFVGWLRIANCLRGEALAILGETDKGIALMSASLEEIVASSERTSLPVRYCSLAQTYLLIGRVVEAEGALGEAFRWLEATDERNWEAELHRVQGEWFVAIGRDGDAQASFDRALQTARRQQAKSWELRTAVDLARLMQRQDRVAEARRMLADVYNWFSEGFDTLDLVTARALLDELEQGSPSTL